MLTVLSSVWIRFLLIVAGCALLVAALLPVIKPPFGVAFAGFALAALLCCIFIKRLWLTYATMILLPLFAVASFMEFHLLAMRDPTPPTHERGDYKGTWNLDDPVRGYGPQPGPRQGHSRIFRNEQLIYDVVYTTDARGRRITPVHADADTAVVFFGCSFTIGEGVKDEESYPYQVAQLLGPRYQTFNYGFHGQGAHQFLSLLENGELDDMAKHYKRIHVYFLNIPLHELRSSGYSDWDTRGPRYVLEGGKAIRRGNFDHWRDHNAFTQAVYQMLKQSFLYREAFTRPRENTLRKLRALDRAIFVRAQELLAQRYPNAAFAVMVYPSAQGNVKELRADGLQTLDTTEFFPLPYTDARYTIPHEWHPTGEAYRVLAEGIAKHVRAR